VNDLTELRSTFDKPAPEAQPVEGPSAAPAPQSTKSDAPVYKSVISSRKPAVKKGLGGRKGLGAQKVTTDFNKLEEDAQKADSEKPSFSKAIASKQLTEEEQVEQIQSMKEAYEDLSERQKENEAKMRISDPKKAEHLERLGMGFNIGSKGRGMVSHNAISDMKGFEQVKPTSSSSSRDTMSASRSMGIKEMEREILLLELGLSTGQPKYRDSPFGKSLTDQWSGPEKSEPDDFWNMESDSRQKAPQVIESIPSLDDDRPSRSRKHNATPAPKTSNDAQQKFGSAKAISSDQFFGNKESEFEQRSTLSKFEGSNSISSDDYFGRTNDRARGGGSGAYSSASSAMGNANLYDIKEGVKDGVSKVAGRLSNLATDVMSSLSEKYNGY
jgi:ADP-ribosylation factor GTPase-activating protein 2/3